MGRNKRKPKLHATREPNGRPSRAAEPKEFPPAQIRRLRDAAVSRMADRCWGTELGRLFLGQKITASQFAAGERWARLVRDYAGAIDLKETLRSASLERGTLGKAPDPSTVAGMVAAACDRAICADFLAAHDALDDAGMVSESITRAVCEGERSAGLFELIYLTNGLNALASHWALSETSR